MNLRNKRILITAGPTWVPIDKVRVISNIATGSTGILLAQALVKLDAKVTLLLGPVGACCLNPKVKIIRFRFFDELKSLIEKELVVKQYDIVIHSAAVSDYWLKNSYRQKVKSGIKQWQIGLAPTPKIINSIKKLQPALFLVGFKFTPQLSKAKLVKQARAVMQDSGADLMVANTIYNGRYNAYIVSQSSVKAAIFSRDKLATALIREIGESLCQVQS